MEEAQAFEQIHKVTFDFPMTGIEKELQVVQPKF